MNRFNLPAIGNVAGSYRNEEPKKVPSTNLDDMLSPKNNNKNKLAP